MSEESAASQFSDLLAYVNHLGSLSQRPVFRVDDYKQLILWEHDLKGRIGIQHNLIDDEGSEAWLCVERLKRHAPPEVPDVIQRWVSVSNDPNEAPAVKEKVIQTVPLSQAEELVESGQVLEQDVREPLKEDMVGQHKDVVFRLANLNSVKTQIDSYLQEMWLPWSEEEKPRRETIKLYDSLFSLQQLIEAQGDEQPIELVWGIGIGRWLCKGHKIDLPLLEKAVEIEIGSQNGTIFVRPRTSPPSLAVNAYVALENTGVDLLLRFTKRHFAELSEDVDFSPFIAESFEPILRQAAARLSESGIYWPDTNKDIQNRTPPNVSETLQVTDSWLIYARPRSTVSFIQDIKQFEAQLESKENFNLPAPAKRFVTPLSDRKPLSLGSGFSAGGVDTSSNGSSSTKPELYFPKPFNEAQVQIIDKLESNDGVVVQGPPGTGKTHTIANIICHYLATGRRVLVTSKGESALTVLRDQIPEELRSLTISLLTNERQGLKQLESAVQLLASMVSQTNPRQLTREAESLEQRVKQLERDIRQIDTEIKEWGLKQLKPVPIELSGTQSPVTAMELAEQLVNERDKHAWLKDSLGTGAAFDPQFNDEDVTNLKEARQKLGDDLIYINSNLLSVQDLPDVANIAAIHTDLANATKLAEKAEAERVPPLAISVPDAVDRAKRLITPLNKMLELSQNLDNEKWLNDLYKSWLDIEDNRDALHVFEDLFSGLGTLTQYRKNFVTNLIEIGNPNAHQQTVRQALDNLCEGKRPFGVLSFGNKEAKTIIDGVRVNSEKPTTTHHWTLVRSYLNFQEKVRRFSAKWNHVGQELDLPELSYSYGSTHKPYQDLFEKISEAKELAQTEWRQVRQELITLFPHGLNIESLPYELEELKKALNAIELNTSRVSLGANRLKLQDIRKKLTKAETPIEQDIKRFLETLGQPSITADEVMDGWQSLMTELSRVHTLHPKLETVQRVTEKIQNSGAQNWATLLKLEPIEGDSDPLTPSFWFESWQWRRREHYLNEIDGHERLKALGASRLQLDSDLKKTFAELVKVKTNIGLHMSMTERVQGALMRFVSSIQKIGKGTGKRAPRHRRDAYRAMQDCYGGVPCWIMPSWRVSESLPSEFASFDLVIIDEASQSDISALPAILRAKKLLIVGDDKQVSPTAAFVAEEKILQLKHNFLRGQPFAELLLPGVSIYDLANAVFPSQRIMLTEHFRCVEPIIRFSMHFYTEQLIPLRLPKASERLNPPLIDVYVPNGIRDERKKTNEAEIDAIVSEIKTITADRQFKGRTIGVISLIGAQQARAIQDRLLFEIGEDIYQKFEITCGDSATFQGKERDIVFLSMVVGPGQGAVMSKREYEQRFNVALSRARDRMYLYRSVQDNDLPNENDLRLKVLRHFAHPMPQQEQVDDLIELCDSGFERDVFKRLSELGYNVTPQVKVGAFSIDLVVEGDMDRRLGIELDGDKYHPPEKWMDDWQRQRTMERVGWKFWRCWGSSYSLDPEGCIADLVNTLENMKIFPTTERSSSSAYTESRVYSPHLHSETQHIGTNDSHTFVKTLKMTL